MAICTRKEGGGKRKRRARRPTASLRGRGAGAIRLRALQAGRFALCIAGLALIAGALPPRAAAQFLPWPFTTPVMDVPRRVEAKRMADLRATEHALRLLELRLARLQRLSLEEIAGSPLAVRDVSASLEGTARLLGRAAHLAGAASPGQGPPGGPALEAAFLDTYLGADGTAGKGRLTDPQGMIVGQAAATLRSLRRVAEAGHGSAGRLEETASFLRRTDALLQRARRALGGRPAPLGSWRASAEASAGLSVEAGAEALLLRQAIAAETTAEIVRAADEVAWEALQRRIVMEGFFGDRASPGGGPGPGDTSPLPSPRQ